jgi:hypothetical protein
MLDRGRPIHRTVEIAFRSSGSMILAATATPSHSRYRNSADGYLAPRSCAGRGAGSASPRADAIELAILLPALVVKDT